MNILQSDIRKVALVSEVPISEINGVNNIVRRLYHWLENLGVSVLLICPEGHSVNTEYNVPGHVTVPSFPIPYYREIKFSPPTRLLTMHLAKFKPDLVHAVSPFILCAGAIRYANRNQIPVIGSYHTAMEYFVKKYGFTPFSSMVSKYITWLHNACTLNLAPAPSTVQMLQTRGVKRLEVFWEGVDTSMFCPSKRHETIRRKYMSDPDSILLVFVGRLAKEKEIHLLKDVLINNDEVELLIVGDGPETEFLKSHFQGTKTTFTGFVHHNDLAPILASADVYMSPSSTETFGQAVLEALASGLPVVAIDSCGVRDNILQPKAGIIVPSDQFADLSSAVKHLILNRAIRESMSVRARQYAEKLTWQKSFETLFSFYETISRADFRPSRVRVA